MIEPRSPRYEIIRELGQGGAGTVFLARDHHLDVQVALKRLHSLAGDVGDLEILEREFSLLAGIEHPGIAKAYDFGTLDGVPFFTSEFVAGETLAAAPPFTDVDAFVEFLRRLVETVAFLHRGEILHLDIKPSNVIVSSGRSTGRSTTSSARGPTGGLAGGGGVGPHPVLIDFGLVRRGLARPPPPVLRGSVPYMAPEYFRGEALGPWTDVYALGVTAYRLATGFYPRRHRVGNGGQGLLEPDWRPVVEVPAESPLLARLEGIVLKCLSLDPALRFGSAAELLEAIEQISKHTSPRRATLSPLVETVGRRHELAALGTFVEGFASAREPAVLALTGAPGMGISHLLRGFKVQAQTRGHAVYLETLYAGGYSPPGAVLRCLSNHLRGEPLKRWSGFLARLGKRRVAARHVPGESERRMRWAVEVAAAGRALTEPVLLAVDGVQYCDEISLELLFDLVRALTDHARGERPSLGIVLAFREEGPLRGQLAELSRLLIESDRASFLTLRGLSVEETLELERRVVAGAGSQRSGGERSSGLDLFQRTGGSPGAIVGATLRSGREQEETDTSRNTAEAFAPLAKRLLLALELIERPAATAELGRVVESSPRDTRALLRGLAARGAVVRVEDAAGDVRWLAGPAAPELDARRGARERRSLHRTIASELVRRSRGDASNPLLAEAVRHLLAASDRAGLQKHGLAVARYQRATFQGRLALSTYRAVFDSLPRSRLRERVEIAVELADLHARLGDLDDGIDFLRGHLYKEVAPGGAKRRSVQHRRVLLALATLYSRRGDFRRADALFREGLEEGDASTDRRASRLPRTDLLHFLNEHAALRVFLGDLDGALELCRRGLELARGSRDTRVRELVLNLYATRANVALRRFDFEAATRDFEAALQIAEAIGSPVNQAVVLNNLGTVHAQSDRFRDAVRAFGDAERVCRQLDEGPSLASIYANLAILHAKIGDFEASDTALADADRLGAGAIGQRERFFIAHARALATLYRGRYGSARRLIDEATAIGETLGDTHVVLYERVARAEALVFEAAYVEAAAELAALSAPSSPGTVRRMATARRALLAGFLGKRAEVEKRLEEYARGAPEREVPFVDAWDRVLLGWAASLAGSPDAAARHLDAAVSYFRRHRLAVGVTFARCVTAEGLLVRGDAAAARRALPAASERGNDFTELFRTLLEARFCVASDPQRAADLVAHAGALLDADALPEWQVRRDSLREALGRRVDQGVCERRRRDIATRLQSGEMGDYLESPWWRAWEVSEAQESVASERGKASVDADPPTTRTVTGRADRIGTRRESLVTESVAMRRLMAVLDRVRDSELPAVITGETGTGKELIARIIHDESPRRAGPFEVVDCGAIPETLLQVELFGARAGAFTDQAQDRAGILERASGGTVFFDEIGGTSLEFQASLLRALSERSVRPLGADEEVSIDVRFVLSTALDLERAVEEGRFRADLFHRIHVVTLEVPPLRERLEDLPGLIEALAGGPLGAPQTEPAALERLRSHGWPGNVRELRNVLLRLRLDDPERLGLEAVERALGDPATTTLFPGALLAGDELGGLKTRLERDYLVYHFRRLGGDSKALCEFLRLTRRQLYNRCERLGVSLREERKRL